MGRKKPWSDLHKILHWGDIQDIITDANLGDDRLSRFFVAMGQILGFSIGFRSRPYNTLALPCECVIKYGLTKMRQNKLLAITKIHTKLWSEIRILLNKISLQICRLSVLSNRQHTSQQKTSHAKIVKRRVRNNQYGEVAFVIQLTLWRCAAKLYHLLWLNDFCCFKVSIHF